MKRTPRSLLYLTLICGALGALLQLWLSGAREESGLLPSFHIAKVLLLILAALYLVFMIVQTGKLRKTMSCQEAYPASPVCAALTALAGVGLAVCAVSLVLRGLMPGDFLSVAVYAVAAVCLLLAALSRMKGRQPEFAVSMALCICAILLSVILGREWGREPQAIRYLFPLFSAVCTMLGAYHHVAFSLQKSSIRSLQLYSQLAVFCCCLSLNDSAGLLYLSLGLWMASNCLSAHEE